MDYVVESFFVVDGEEVNEDFSNIEVIVSKLIPNIGDIINLRNKRLKVIGRVLNYTQVEDYNTLDNPDRGGEMVYIFTKRI